MLEALFSAGVVDPLALAQWIAQEAEGGDSLRHLPEDALLRPLQAFVM